MHASLSPSPPRREKIDNLPKLLYEKKQPKMPGVFGGGGGIGATFRKPGLIWVATNIIVEFWVICSSVIDEN